MARRQKERQEAMEATQETTTDPAVVAAGASVLLSWHYFFIKGERDMGIFVGLWPPTILAFASYFEQTRMSNKIKRATGTGGIRESVQRIVQGEQ
jgi:hypothetical protein